jgi:hypothetical protein
MDIELPPISYSFYTKTDIAHKNMHAFSFPIRESWTKIAKSIPNDSSSTSNEASSSTRKKTKG